MATTTEVFQGTSEAIVQKDTAYPGGHRPEVTLGGAVNLTLGDIGTVDQGTPNGGGANAWPVTDAALGAKADAAATTDTGTFSIVAFFKRLLQGVTSILSNTAAPLDTNNGWVDVNLATGLDSIDDSVTALIADGGDTTFGAQADGAAAGDTSTATYMGLFKRLLQRITTLIGLLPASLGAGGGLKVDGSGTALPVSGTVTANAGTGNFTVVQATAANLKVDPSSVTSPVSIAGTVTVDTELPAAAALADAATNPTTALIGGCLHGWNGATWDRVRVQNVRKDLNAVAIGSIATVWTPASGKKFRVMGGMLSLSSAASILAEDNAGGTTLFRTPKLLADTPYNFDFGNGILSGAADRVLKFTSSAAANVTGTLYGTEE